MTCTRFALCVASRGSNQRNRLFVLAFSLPMNAVRLNANKCDCRSDVIASWTPLLLVQKMISAPCASVPSATDASVTANGQTVWNRPRMLPWMLILTLTRQLIRWSIDYCNHRYLSARGKAKRKSDAGTSIFLLRRKLGLSNSKVGLRTT